MPRLMLTEDLWSKLKVILLEHRQTLEGIIYRLRVGCPWGDLPECFGLFSLLKTLSCLVSVLRYDFRSDKLDIIGN